MKLGVTKGDSVRNRLWSVSACAVVLVGLAAGQTFPVNGQGSRPAAKGKQSSKSAGSSLGWGSSIEVARQARAAQDALKRGDYAAAANYAEKAAKAAPQNADLWFLLGYTARLAGQYSTSVDAYNRGLQVKPGSIQGRAGLAQTYARMGRTDQAREILLKVVAEQPKDVDNLRLAGELLLSSDAKEALDLLRRADSLKSSARTELLIARAYQRLEQPEQARQFLQRAKNKAPHDPEILRAVAGEYRDNGEYDLAIATLRDLPKKNTGVLAELAYTYELAGKKQQAADLYSKLARGAKGNIGLQLSAAQALLKVGDEKAAQAFLGRAQSLNANSYRLHAILGEVAKSEGQLPEAIHHYEVALRNLSANPPEGALYPIQIRLNLRELYGETGDQSAAKQQLDLAGEDIQRVPPRVAESAEFFRLRAAIESSSGNLEAADKDLKHAMALAPSSVNVALNYATLLWKRGDKDAARDMFLRAEKLDHGSGLALVSLGYLARDMGDVKDAETYFSRAIKLRPKEYIAYLALADLQAAQRKFSAAEGNYEAAFRRMPTNALTVAGGANAALEAHKLDLAKRWLDRASVAMNENPQVMRERERYLTWKHEYQEAARLGYKVIEKLPRDAEAPVYLAYDLYYLGRYQDFQELAAKYDAILPKNKDFALIRGYIDVRAGKYEDAENDFTVAIGSDPKMATGYVNRGYVRNDLRQASKAVSDFQTALQIQPKYPEARLGLAYSYLQLHHPGPALEELDRSKKSLGDNRVWHLARGEAFRQQQRFALAEPEYREALEQKPDDRTTHLTLADVLFHLRRYDDCIQELNTALKLSPDDPKVYASLAEAYAHMGQRQETLRYVEAAEKYGKGQVDILMSTGDALLTLGDRDAAMQRFSRALETDDRVGIRLAIAKIFVGEGRWDDARRQVGLGFAEARVGDAEPVTAEDFVEAGNIFLTTHDLDLAQTYFQKARQAGGNERVVALGLANTYLAEGDPDKAKMELASLGDPRQYRDDYDYMMVMGNVYRERRDTLQALSAFAQAHTLAGTDEESKAEDAQFAMTGEEGRRITQNVSLLSQASFGPVLEDINIYTLDAKLLHVTDPALLPPPRHSFATRADEHYRVHLSGFPTIEGFVGEHMYSGKLSFPSNDVIQDRNTYDTVLNGGVSPQLRLGSAILTFNTGLQFTLRRDTTAPRFMNQNLFRQFLYLSTSPLFNWVSVRGGISRETGPFAEQNLHSRDAVGNLEFAVGRPWGHTSLLAGYSARDLLFRPVIREYYTTSTYLGLQHKFGNFSVAGLGEYLRSWRVEGSNWAIAQAMRPAVRFEYHPSSRWQVQGSVLLSRGEGFHAYDNVESQFLVSYVRPVGGKFEDGHGDFTIAYPFQFSFGLEQQTFYDFPGSSGRTVVLPVVRLKLF